MLSDTLFTTVADDAVLGAAALALTVAVLLLVILVNASVARPFKLAAVAVTFVALFAAWQSMIRVLGLPTSAALPADYEVLAHRVTEPDARSGEDGAIVLWVVEAGPDDTPRAHALPYTEALHKQLIRLTRARGRHERLLGQTGKGGGVELALEATRLPAKPVVRRK